MFFLVFEYQHSKCLQKCMETTRLMKDAHIRATCYMEMIRPSDNFSVLVGVIYLIKRNFILHIHIAHKILIQQLLFY